MASVIGSKKCDARLDRLGWTPAGPEWGRATGRLTVLNRTPESFKTDVAPQWPDDSSSFAKSGRRVADLLQAWHRFVVGALSSFIPRIRTPEGFKTDAAPEWPDESPSSLLAKGGRQVADLLQAWHRFVVGTFSNLSQRASEMLKAAAAPLQPDDSPSLVKSWRRRGAELLLQGWHLFVRVAFSSLSRRIIFLNVTGLLALVVGILYLSQFRAGLIDARIQSLLVQGEIIAGAITASATVETDTITIDPERLLELQAGQSYGPSEEALSGLESARGSAAARCRSIASSDRRAARATARSAMRCRASNRAWCASTSAAR